MARTFVLNMVGCFYSTFMLGTTGGDVLKAYYASKQTPHRTEAVMSVLVDRAIGLLALIILGGAMAGLMALYLFFKVPAPNDPVRWMCARVAGGALLICLGLGVGLFCFFQPRLRHLLGLDFFLSKLRPRSRCSRSSRPWPATASAPALCSGR